MFTHRLPAALARLAHACRAFLADERGSVIVDYAVLTTVTTTLAVVTEKQVGHRVAHMLYDIAQAIPN